jgi:radical SAM superfamily enzyme YgiQ (UPF0313 family)
MKRPYSAKIAEAVLRAMHSEGMVACIDFIIGYPTETEEDFQQTLQFISRVKDYVSNISIAPYCAICKNDLEFHPDRYGIYALNNGGNSWESEHSTPEIRAKRYKATLDLLDSLGISHRYSDSDRKFFSDSLRKTQ